MKKIISKILSIIQIILLLISFLIRHLTVTRMGFARYIVYLNNEIKSFVPLKEIWIIIFILLVILFILNIVRLFRLANKTRKIVIDLAINILLLIAISYHFVLMFTSSMRDYFFLALIYSIISFIQLLKSIIC